MLIVVILRWLCGYIEFKVYGKFPERFLNLATKRGINIWQLKSREKELYAKAKRSDYESLEAIAEKTQTETAILSRN